MRFLLLSLVGFSVFFVPATSKPSPVKGSYTKDIAREALIAENNEDQLLAEYRQAERRNDNLEVHNDGSSSKRNFLVKTSNSNARRFLRRFMPLKNLFNKRNQPIIIRIFLNGTSPNIPIEPTGPIAPTGPNIPTGPTGIAPTGPTGPSQPSPTGPTGPSAPIQPGPSGPSGPSAPVQPGPSGPSGPSAPVQPGPSGPSGPSAPVQPGPSGPSARDEYIEHADAENTLMKLPAHVNYQRKAIAGNQAIIVRIPAKYRHLFNNGQQVKLSTKKSVNKRRVANRTRPEVIPNKVNSNKSVRMKNKLARIISI